MQAIDKKEQLVRELSTLSAQLKLVAALIGEVYSFDNPNRIDALGAADIAEQWRGAVKKDLEDEKA